MKQETMINLDNVIDLLIKDAPLWYRIIGKTYYIYLFILQI